jgi:dTDP-4-dehydrorhamnose reductase
MPGVTVLPMGLDNRNWVKRVIYTAQPEVIIYAAGSEDVAWAKLNPKAADRIQAGGLATIAEFSDFFQSRLVYLSSARVFEGVRGNYREGDVVLPGEAHGKSKVAAENFLRARSLNYLIVRCSPLLGRSNGLNLSVLDRWRMAFDRSLRVELSDQEVHSFAPIEGLCALVEKLIESGLRNRIFHYSGLTRASWRDLGEQFCARWKYDPKFLNSPAEPSAKVYDFSLNSTEAVKAVEFKPQLLLDGLHSLGAPL